MYEKAFKKTLPKLKPKNDGIHILKGWDSIKLEIKGVGNLENFVV